MESLQYVLPWVLACVLVGLGIGYYLGVSVRGRQQDRVGKREAEQTLQALKAILAATEELNNEVANHDSEIQQVGRQLVDMRVDGIFRDVQLSLLKEVAGVLEANHKLEDDLNYARLRMEEQAIELDRTRQEARLDALSGVHNRKAFDEKLQMQLGALKRENTPLVLALCDVDHFKWINDTHGHQAGDKVVSGIGEFLKAALRPNDFVARLGGDEFALLLRTDLANGAAVMERIRNQVSRKNFGLRDANHEQAAVTFSIGVADAVASDSVESIYKRADAALYRSKENGRNNVSCIQPNGEYLSKAPKPPETPPPTLPQTLDNSDAVRVARGEGPRRSSLASAVASRRGEPADQ